MQKNKNIGFRPRHGGQAGFTPIIIILAIAIVAAIGGYWVVKYKNVANPEISQQQIQNNSSSISQESSGDTSKTLGRVILKGSHQDISVSNTPPAPQNMQIIMDVVLSLQNQVGLNQMLEDIQDPNSPNYHKWFTPEQFNAKYAPTQKNFDAVSNWFKENNFTVTKIDMAARDITFTGTVAQAEAVFETKIVIENGNYWNTTDVTIPAELSGIIGGVSLTNIKPIAVPGG